MNNEGMKRVYFVGIGGIGMSALARYYQSRGWAVSGYDLTPSPLTRQLEREGMAIHYEDLPESLPALIDLAVYTPAVPSSLGELQALRSRNIPLLKRSEALGLISKEHYTIAVAGTHGKTTTTAMVAHILKENGVDMTAFIGGIANNFGSNLHLGRGPESVLVVEADEYDRSFLRLAPNISIVNAIDADHLDIYGDQRHLVEGFEQFAALSDDCVIVKEGLALEGETAPQLRFGFGPDNAFQASDIEQHDGETDFVLVHDEERTPVHLNMAGLHNVLNATAAFAATATLGLEPEGIAAALATFRGVQRRFDIRVKNSRHCYIDDYAHHPEELASAIRSLRGIFPGKKLTAVFQPHLYTRTRDFADGFAASLSQVDKLILLPIYPAREEPIPGVDSEMILGKVTAPEKVLIQKEDLISYIEKEPLEVLVTFGAGNIDRYIEPITRLLSERA